jgi:hypothetical protein
VTTAISKSIAYIVEGGDGLAITKDFDEHGNMYIKRVRDFSKDLKQSYSFVCDYLDSSINKIIRHCQSLSKLCWNYRSYLILAKLAAKTTLIHLSCQVQPIMASRSYLIGAIVLPYNVLANNNNHSFEYIVRWMAHIIAKPQERTGDFYVSSGHW